MSAFTLVEMLVVVAILGILMALIVPGIQKMLQRSATVTSASNLRQLGTALLLYANENRGYFPPTAITTRSEVGHWENLGTWDTFLLPYLGVELPFPRHPNREMTREMVDPIAYVFAHPRDKSVITERYLFGGGLRHRRSYAMPRTLAGTARVGTVTWEGQGWFPSQSVIAIPAPSSTILLTEKPGYDGNHINRLGEAGLSGADEQSRFQPDLNAGGRFNYLFCDGHVQFLHPEKTIGTGTLQNPKGFWSLDPED